jgi:hypothetical protein
VEEKENHVVPIRYVVYVSDVFRIDAIPERSTSIDKDNVKALRFYKGHASLLAGKAVAIRPPKALPQIPVEVKAPGNSIQFPQRSTSIRIVETGKSEEMHEKKKKSSLREGERMKYKSMSPPIERVRRKKSTSKKSVNAVDEAPPPPVNMIHEESYASIHDLYKMAEESTKPKTTVDLYHLPLSSSPNPISTLDKTSPTSSTSISNPRPISSRSRARSISKHPVPAQRRAIIWSGTVTTFSTSHRLFLFTDLLLETNLILNGMYEITRLVPLSTCDVSFVAGRVECTTWTDGVFRTESYEMENDSVGRDVYNHVVGLKSEGMSGELEEDFREVADLVAGEVFEREELEKWCCDL